MENQYSRYIARKRARFSAFGVPVNIPWGTPLEVRDGFIYFGEQPLCTVTSDIAYCTSAWTKKQGVFQVRRINF